MWKGRIVRRSSGCGKRPTDSTLSRQSVKETRLLLHNVSAPQHGAKNEDEDELPRAPRCESVAVLVSGGAEGCELRGEGANCGKAATIAIGETLYQGAARNGKWVAR
jgi:hypothetical protein